MALTQIEKTARNTVKVRKWRAEHPGRSAATAERWRQRHPEQYREVYMKQAARRRAKREALAPRPCPDICEMCGRSIENRGADFDHDHSCCEHGCSECFREWLCRQCNVILGHAHDDPELLRKLADYLDH